MVAPASGAYMSLPTIFEGEPPSHSGFGPYGLPVADPFHREYERGSTSDEAQG